MQITTDPTKITAALKAVRAFVSEDSTRSNICNVYAEVLTAAKLKFTATDGHTLCSVTIDGADVGGSTARLTPLAVDTLLLQAKAAKGLSVSTFVFEDCKDEGRFPDYAQVVPERTSAKQKADSVHGLNAVYLARLATVQKAVKADGCRVQFGANDSPMRADITGALADAVVILMPMRLGAEAA